MNRQKDQLDSERIRRADRIQVAIAALKKQIHYMERQGVVAPPDCYVARYQVRQQQRVYWYYKLQATDAIFEQATAKVKKSKYKHLGKGGTQAHIDAVMQVARRAQIDELQRAINSLSDSWLDILSGTESMTTSSSSEPEP